MSKRNELLFLLLIPLVWKIVRTDWIVMTNYEFFERDSPPAMQVRTYTPPVSPLFLPPKPQDFEPTATTWWHDRFFPIGGFGGPTEEPRLHINWPLLLFKMGAGMLAGYLWWRGCQAADARRLRG